MKEEKDSRSIFHGTLDVFQALCSDNGLRVLNRTYLSESHRLMTMSSDTKDTNPKDTIGGTKLPLDLVPDTGIAYAALAFMEGALKYGKYNWRIKGVRWSIYEAAFERHRMKIRQGEWEDPITKVPHMASMLACLMIVLDAKEADKLIDDRPPRVEGFSKFVDDLSYKVVHLKEVFKEHNPKQYTIFDGVEGDLYGCWTGKQADKGSACPPEPTSVPREDAQSLPGRDTRCVVFKFTNGLVGRMEVVKFNTFVKGTKSGKADRIVRLQDDSYCTVCNSLDCTEPQCIANRVAQGQMG